MEEKQQGDENRAEGRAEPKIDVSLTTGPVGEGARVTGVEIGRYYSIEEELSYQVHGLPNPYFGLRAFSYADRAAFGGREQAVSEAVNQLSRPGAQQTILFITGASGTGKSSFVQAGLLPALEGYYKERHKGANRAVFHPSSEPLVLLADALAQLGMPELSIAALSRFTPAEFGRFLAENTPIDQINLLVIDQFEEIFTQSAPSQRDALLSLLSALPAFHDVRIHILAALRSDFLQELFNHQALWNIAKQGVELRAMSKEELKEAIQQPLWAACKGENPDERYCQKRFDPALLERLARDAAQEAAYLPLLQLALQELWNGGSLALGRYQGLADAIQRQADEFYRYSDFGKASPQLERPEEDRAEITSLILDLVSVTGPGEAPLAARRQRWMDELAGESEPRRKLVAELLDARLLTTSQEPRGGRKATAVNLIHESLLDNWTLLKNAINAQQETLRRRARFETYLGEWMSSREGEKPGYLLSGARLEDARRLSAANDIALKDPQAKEFVRQSYEQSEAEAQRRLRLESRARMQLQALAGLLGLLLLASLAWNIYPYLLSLAARGALASIPAGNAVLGPDLDYAPPRGTTGEKISLHAFQIERFEVTNRQYRLCVRARRCSVPTPPYKLSDPDLVNHPVTGVTALQAFQYCSWIGRRLPDEVEWERAARGPEGSLWPWGNSPPPSPERANLTYESSRGKGSSLAPIGGRPLGCTQVQENEGICDLIGNASEWTASRKPDDGRYHPGAVWQGDTSRESLKVFLIVRGSNYTTSWVPSGPFGNLAMNSDFYPIFSDIETFGFRCARD